MQRSLHAKAEGSAVDSGAAAAEPFAHNFSQLSVYQRAPVEFQTKLIVNEPGDIYEQEANRVTEQVMWMSQPQVQRQTPQEHAETPVQVREGNNRVPKAASLVRRRVQTIQGRGESLPAAARAFFEPRFGHDFTQVRVHTDATAAESARSVNALAYTVGPDIVFGAGQYAPETTTGRKLLAHELAHVVQQGDSQTFPLVQRQLSQPPTKLITSEVEEVSFPENDEAALDKVIESRKKQDAKDGKKYIGNVTYKNLPPPEKAPKKGKEANVERRAMKHALLEVIITNIQEKAGIEMRVRVPLENAVVALEYAMVVLRFDNQRNVEVEYAGKDVQKRGAVALTSSILPELEKAFEVKFVTDSITVTMPGDKRPSTLAGKEWSAEDAVLLKDALPLVGSNEKKILKGCKIRRLDAERVGDAAGFYSTGDNSINLTNAALPFDKSIWFGEGGKFYTRGVHTLLHEIGHALHFAPAPSGSPRRFRTMMDLFKNAVREESKKRTKTDPGAKFPPPGIIPPTDYAATRWDDFYADTYSIYITNPSFLDTAEFKYLYAFFKQHFP